MVLEFENKPKCRHTILEERSLIMSRAFKMVCRPQRFSSIHDWHSWVGFLHLSLPSFHFLNSLLIYSKVLQLLSCTPSLLHASEAVVCVQYVRMVSCACVFCTFACVCVCMCVFECVVFVIRPYPITPPVCLYCLSLGAQVGPFCCL